MSEEQSYRIHKAFNKISTGCCLLATPLCHSGAIIGTWLTTSTLDTPTRAILVLTSLATVHLAHLALSLTITHRVNARHDKSKKVTNTEYLKDLKESYKDKETKFIIFGVIGLGISSLIGAFAADKDLTLTSLEPKNKIEYRIS